MINVVTFQVATMNEHKEKSKEAGSYRFFNFLKTHTCSGHLFSS